MAGNDAVADVCGRRDVGQSTVSDQLVVLRLFFCLFFVIFWADSCAVVPSDFCHASAFLRRDFLLSFLTACVSFDCLFGLYRL
jgi:hypothetical protein